MVTPTPRLAVLLRDNGNLIRLLAISRDNIMLALTYLEEPNCHVAHGEAELADRLDNYHKLIARIRANRLMMTKMMCDGCPCQPEGLRD